MPLRDLVDPYHLPTLAPAYAIQLPALGLGATDPATIIPPCMSCASYRCGWKGRCGAVRNAAGRSLAL